MFDETPETPVEETPKVEEEATEGGTEEEIAE